MQRKFYQLGLAAVAAAIVSLASYSDALAQCSTGNAYLYSQCGTNENKPSTAVVSSETVRTAVTQTANILSDRIAQLTSGQTQTAMTPSSRVVSLGDSGNLQSAFGETGLGAANGTQRFGAWIGGNFTSVDYDRRLSNFDGHIWTIMGGVDFRLSNRFVLGIAGGYENQDYDTAFNRGDLEGTGWTIAPYAVFSLTRNIGIDAAFGYSNIDYDMTRRDPSPTGGGNVGGGRITGSTDANRYFATINGTGRYTMDRWRLAARIGTTWALEQQDAFRESNGVRQGAETTAIGFVNVGPQVGYAFGNIEPYVRADARGFYEDANSSDSFDAVFGAGVRWNLGRGASLNVEGTTVQFRDDYEEYGVGAAFRLQF